MLHVLGVGCSFGAECRGIGGFEGAAVEPPRKLVELNHLGN